VQGIAENVSRMWANKNAYRVLVGNRNESDGVQDQGIDKKKYSKVDLKGIQINPAQVRHKRSAVLNTAMNHRLE
jgi:hypothetical protein